MPGSNDIHTCPKCGALITPQLKRCRQCGHYLHGTAVEGWLMGFLPGNLREYPATAVLMLMLIVVHAVLIMLAGPSSILGFSGFTLVQFGSMFGPSFLMGEWWRPVTAMFLHAGPVHILFNVWALSLAGRYVEQLYDAKKMFILFIVSGVVGGLASFGFKLYIMHDYLAGSVGASGAICGLIGATMVAARRMGPDGREVFREMVRWAIILVVFGFIAPGIDNAGHAAGFLVGAGLAYVVPTGLTQTVVRNKILSVVSLALLAGVLGTFVYAGYQVYDEPLSVKHDAEGSHILWFTVRKGEDWDTSGQRALLEQCVKPVERVYRAELKAQGIKKFEWKQLQMLTLQAFHVLLRDVKVTPAMVRKCEVAFKANRNYRISYDMLSALYEKTGEKRKARVLADLIPKIFRRIK